MNVRDVCGVPMGGLPGETPSLLVGSMFFDRQKLVIDASAGEFDEDEAKRLLDLQDHWSQITGNPAGLDVIASTTGAMQRYLDFATEHFQGPILVDGTDGRVKIAGIEHMASRGLADRVIYNSISPETTAEEFESIEACGVKAAVVLAVDPSDFSGQRKVELLTAAGGLLARARECGVEHTLVDPGVIDLPSVGTVKAVFEAVRALDCLCGAAPHNAVSTWGGLAAKLGSSFKPAATAVLNALPIAWGGDFVIYGPPNLASTVFPAVAMVDVILAQGLVEQGKIPGPDHPMFKIA